MPCGSGSLTMSSSRWFCQKHSENAITNANAVTISRDRSSSRCSTTLRRSSWVIGLMRGTARGCYVRSRLGVGGLRLARGAGGLRLLVGRRRRDVLGGRRLDDLALVFVIVVVPAGDGVLELAQAAAERP